MIDTLYLANFIENQLNANSLGIKYLVFADEGDLRKSYKYGNTVVKYTQGLVEVISSQITPIKNLQFQTINAQLMMLIDLNEYGKVESGDNDREQSQNLLYVKQSISEMIERLNGKTIPIELDGRVYTMTIVMQQPTDGQKMAFGALSECLPIYLSMSFTLFENGVNGNDYEINIDGENVYFTKGVVTRVKVTEQNSSYFGKNTKSSVQANGLSIDFTTPQLESILCNKIEDELLDGTDKAYCVILKRKNKERAYLCSNMATQQSFEPSVNIGLNLSFAEAVEDLLDYEPNKWVEIETKVLDGELTTLRNVSGEKIVIFWGDNTSQITEDMEISHAYSENGTYTIRVYCSTMNSNDWIYETYTNYAITYNLDGGSADNPETYTEITEDFILNNPIKEGHTFIGWTGTGYETNTMVVTIRKGTIGDLVFTAHWTLNNYTITFDADGGSVQPTSKQVTYGQTYGTLPTPTKDGYTFDAWYNSQNQKITSNSIVEITGDETLTAQWFVNYNINYNLDGGQLPAGARTTYSLKDNIVLMPEPTKSGYYFNGWYNDGYPDGVPNPFTVGVTFPLGDITLNARWVAETYKMTYDYNDGIVESPNAYPTYKNVTYGNSIGSLYNASKITKNGDVGYGWKIDGVQISSSTIWNWGSDKTAEIIWFSEV